jgi:hypothetical protein
MVAGCPKAIFVDCATKINIINPKDTRRKKLKYLSSFKEQFL